MQLIEREYEKPMFNFSSRSRKSFYAIHLHPLFSGYAQPYPQLLWIRFYIVSPALPPRIQLGCRSSGPAQVKDLPIFLYLAETRFAS
jgi:hypothetical protein